MQTSSYLASSKVVDKAKKISPLFQLRQKTGLAYNLCREALDKHDNDVVKAENWLTAQALAHGLQRATKIRDRSAREGIVGLAIQKSNKIATVLELNCETDFVVKNQVFKDFALGLTEQVASISCAVHGLGDGKPVVELKPPKDELDRLDEEVVSLITRLGENIKIQRASQFQANEDDVQIFGQIHAQAGQKSMQNLDIMTGRFGAIVGLRDATKTKGRLLTGLGNRLCQHVIGYNPTYIELPEDIKSQIEDAEKKLKDAEKLLEDAGDQLEDSDKDLTAAEDDIQEKSHEEWPSIMDQPLIFADDLLVKDYCKEHDISVVYFNRFECGDSN